MFFLVKKRIFPGQVRVVIFSQFHWDFFVIIESNLLHCELRNLKLEGNQVSFQRDHIVLLFHKVLIMHN